METINDIRKVDSYQELSEVCADILIHTVIEKPDARIIAAAGYSPREAYRLFVKRIKEERIDVSHITFIKLDEWAELAPVNPVTCEYFLQKELIEPLKIDKDHYISFDAMAGNLEEECSRIQKELDRAGEIDLCILGLGMNGHLGLNEPGQVLYPMPHVTNLDYKTRTHAMLKEADTAVSRGITLGIWNLLSSAKIILLVTGDEKREALEIMLKGCITTTTPASILNLHKNVTVIIDQEIFRVIYERKSYENRTALL